MRWRGRKKGDEDVMEGRERQDRADERRRRGIRSERRGEKKMEYKDQWPRVCD